MPQLFANNAYSALLGALSAVATSLTVAAGTGDRFPSPSGTDYFLLTLADVSGGTESAWEIVKVTARVGDVLTIERAQEGTVARIWNSGTPVDLRITANTFNDLPVSTVQQTALNLKANAASPVTTGTFTHSGDVVLSGSGKRITGDFSNATIANRVMFQTSTPNSSTGVGVIPNGSGSTSFFGTYGESDPNNTHFLSMVSDSVRTFLESGVTGAGVAKPLIVYVGGAERMRVATTGDVLVTSPAGLGYGVGAGGTVTQATSKSTAVTLNKPCGQITMNAASLAAGTGVIFTLNNSLVTTADGFSAAISGGSSNPDAYIVRWRVAAGAVSITVINGLGSPLAEAVQLTFVLLKGATS